MEGEIYSIGYWTNPYSGAKEYFWMRSDDRKEAKEKFKRAMKCGQPKTFTNWAAGACKYYSNKDKFIADCAKVKLNPRLED